MVYVTHSAKCHKTPYVASIHYPPPAGSCPTEPDVHHPIGTTVMHDGMQMAKSCNKIFDRLVNIYQSTDLSISFLEGCGVKLTWKKLFANLTDRFVFLIRLVFGVKRLVYWIDQFLSTWMFLFGDISSHIGNSYLVGPNFMARDDDEHDKGDHVPPWFHKKKIVCFDDEWCGPH